MEQVFNKHTEDKKFYINYDYFTENQQKVIKYKKGHVLVNASAGSGKTATIINRVANLLLEGVPGNRILLITFTKAAADEMKRRLTDLVGRHDVNVGTIHSASYKLLKYFTQEKYSVMNIFEESSALQRIAKDKKLYFSKINYYEILADYSKCRNNNMKFDEIASWFESNHTKFNVKELSNLKELLFQYDLWKRSASVNKINFDDMTIWLNELLAGAMDYREEINNMFDYLIVDEAQDCNPVQHEFINYIASAHTMLVGDVWQSIYGFRGAAVDLFIDFVKKYNADIILLDKNFRSTAELVEFSNRFTNKGHFLPDYLKKETLPHKAISGKDINYMIFENNYSQNEYIAKNILKQLKKNKLPYNEIAILSRINMSLFFICKHLIKHKIPFITRGKFSISEVNIVLDFMSVLHAIKNQEDIPYKKFSSIMKLQPYMRKTTIRDLYDTYREMGDFFALDFSKYERIEDIASFLMGQENELSITFDFIDYIINNYIPHKYTNINTVDNLIDFMKLFLQFLDEYKKEPFTVIIDELDYIFNNKNKEGVILSTIHGAKGLEWDIVYLIDVNEGILPYGGAVGADLEEEMRVFYVGITRPREELFLCSCKMLFDRPFDESSFINMSLRSN